MRNLIYVALFLLMGCTSQIEEKDLALLNGYWEIKEVIFADGSTKEYRVNTSIDYIEYKNKKGFRKKVQPKLDGTYTTNNDADIFTVLQENKSFLMHYNTNSEGLNDTRTENLVSLTKDKFTVRTLDGVTYKYHKFVPINISK